MAYMKPLDEQNQQQTQQGQNVNQPVQNVSSGGGQIVSSSPGLTSSSSANTSGQAPTRSSSNWVNIEDYLKVNPSIGQNAINQGKSLLGNESDVYKKASDPLRNAENNFSLQQMTPEQIQQALAKGDISGIQNVLNQKGLNGTGLTYDPYASGNINKVKSLSNANTAMDVLASDAIGKGNYGMGLRGLDTALLGADSAYKAGSTDLWNNVNNYLTNTKSDYDKLVNTAKEDTGKVTKSQSDARSELDKARDTTTTNLNKEYQDAQQQQNTNKEDYMKQYQDWYNNVYQPALSGHYSADPVTGNYEPHGGFTYRDLFKSGPMSNFVDPTLSNVGSSSEYNTLSALNKLGYDTQGLPNQSTGNWQLASYGPAQWKQSFDAWMNSPEGKAANLGSATPVLGGQALNDVNNAIAQLTEQAQNRSVTTPEEMARLLGLS